jgi:cytochrome c peroxidase
MKTVIGLLVIFVLFQSCNTPSVSTSDSKFSYKAPSFFPDITFPADNAPTSLRIQLGRRLFFDTRLSANNKISCASCHVASMAFTDGVEKSIGAHGKQSKRNAPTLANLAWMPYFMAEGGVPNLEVQILGPIQDSMEMAFPLPQAAEILRADIRLNNLSKVTYGRELDEYVITRAIACYERSFISGDTRFDRFYYLKKQNELNESEKRGMQIFFSEKANCSTCHKPPLFTDYKFYNVGLYENYEDNGKERVTYKTEDIGKFKTPTLRNIELTAPYMHDGSVNTLLDVIELYNKGGAAHPNKSDLIVAQNWSDEEKKDLEAFLKSLTDWNFAQNPLFVPLEP